ncbi:MAG: hypothetical protein LBL19_01375, partial [Spirochaetaceae bacterium]|nr:hypothetical protein [Spirochaetaceae bacterium]
SVIFLEAGMGKVLAAKLPFIHKSRAKKSPSNLQKRAMGKGKKGRFLLEMGLLAKNDWIIRFCMRENHSASCKKSVI